MKIEKYVASLMPSIRKDKILEDIGLVRKELNESTIPAYESIAVLFAKWKWKSKEMQAHAATFSRLAHGGNLIEAMIKGLKDISAALTVAEEYISKTYNEETVTAAITYKKANVLQFVDAIAFVSSYARKFANYLLVCETSVEDAETKLNEMFVPAELSFIQENFITFCQAFKALAIPARDVSKRIEETPEIVVKASSAQVMNEVHGDKKLDSFGLNIVAPKWNLFFHLGRAWADFQVSRYNAAREELALIQMRKLYLEKLNAKRPDAALADEILFHTDRVETLNRKIAKMEASYA